LRHRRGVHREPKEHFMRYRSLLIALTAAAGTLFPGQASAQSAGAFMANPAFTGPRPERCESTFDMQHCAADDLRIADARMSARYNALRARLGPAARKRLLTDQRAWLTRRDRNCLRAGDRYRGGTLSAVTVALCWVNETRARDRALAKWK
jgi:uncharacterized protein YecT (DUF1311 family)